MCWLGSAGRFNSTASCCVQSRDRCPRVAESLHGGRCCGGSCKFYLVQCWQLLHVVLHLRRCFCGQTAPSGADTDKRYLQCSSCFLPRAHAYTSPHVQATTVDADKRAPLKMQISPPAYSCWCKGLTDAAGASPLPPKLRYWPSKMATCT